MAEVPFNAGGMGSINPGFAANVAAQTASRMGNSDPEAQLERTFEILNKVKSGWESLADSLQKFRTTGVRGVKDDLAKMADEVERLHRGFTELGAAASAIGTKAGTSGGRGNPAANFTTKESMEKNVANAKSGDGSGPPKDPGKTEKTSESAGGQKGKFERMFGFSGGLATTLAGGIVGQLPVAMSRAASPMDAANMKLMNAAGAGGTSFSRGGTQDAMGLTHGAVQGSYFKGMPDLAAAQSTLMMGGNYTHASPFGGSGGMLAGVGQMTAASPWMTGQAAAQTSLGLMGPGTINRLYRHGALKSLPKNQTEVMDAALKLSMRNTGVTKAQLDSAVPGSNQYANLSYLLGGDQNAVQAAIQQGRKGLGMEYDEKALAPYRTENAKADMGMAVADQSIAIQAAMKNVETAIINGFKDTNDAIQNLGLALGANPGVSTALGSTVGSLLGAGAGHLLTKGGRQAARAAVGSRVGAAAMWGAKAAGAAATAGVGATAATVGLVTAGVVGTAAIAYSAVRGTQEWFNRRTSDTSSEKSAVIQGLMEEARSRGLSGEEYTRFRSYFNYAMEGVQSGDHGAADEYIAKMRVILGQSSGASRGNTPVGPGSGEGDPPTAIKTSKPFSHIAGLASPLRQGLEAMFRDNPDLVLNSGYRSNAHQARLFKDAVKKYGSEKAARKWVAPPGKSNHNRGLAADIGPPSQRDWLRSNAHKYGLEVPMPWEPWHVEVKGTRSGKGKHDTMALGSPGLAHSGGGEDGGSSSGGGVTAPRGYSTSDELSRFHAFMGGGGGGGSFGYGTNPTNSLLEKRGSVGDGVVQQSLLGRARVIASAAKGAGFRGAALVDAIAVALAESGGDPNATNKNRNGSIDYGLWQINSVHKGSGFNPAKASDPNYNAGWAKRIHAERGNWTAWYAHTPKGQKYGSGPYRKYIDEAQQVVGNGVGDPPTPSDSPAAAGNMNVFNGGGKTVTINFYASGNNSGDARSVVNAVVRHLRDEEQFAVLGST